MKAVMKSRVLLVMLLVAVIGGTYVYAQWRTQAPDTDIDKRAAGLSGLERLLPKGARITFVCPDNNATLYGICRYVLAPRYLSFKEEKKYDTALMITKIQATESDIKIVTDNRKILWQNTDSIYRYYLTCPL